MRYDDDEADLPAIGRVEIPTSVRIAGIVWIVFGALILVNPVINLLAGGGGGGDMVAVLIVILFGAVFINVGVQSLRGTAADTLGNGIGSIIFGVLNAGYGAMIFVGAAVGGLPMALAVVIGGISILGGIGLLTAGVLALVGRQDYKAWRQANLRL